MQRLLPTVLRLSGVAVSATDGTAWYLGNGKYPMESALDYYTDGFEYSPVNLSYSPTSTEKASYKSRLTDDVWLYGQGIAGNAWEVAGGPHLNGHPSSKTIYHWIAVRGYNSGGEATRYADPVSGSSVSWAGSVPPYSEMSSNTVVTIFGGRGYIW